MKKHKKLNTVAVFTIVIMVLFMTVIAIEVIFALYNEKKVNKKVQNYNVNLPIYEK